MEDFFLIYTGKKVPAILEFAIRNEKNLLKATTLSEYHKLCRTKPISIVFVAERIWRDIRLLIMHPEHRRYSRFFIVCYKFSGGNLAFTPAFLPPEAYRKRAPQGYRRNILGGYACDAPGGVYCLDCDRHCEATRQKEQVFFTHTDLTRQLEKILEAYKPRLRAPPEPSRSGKICAGQIAGAIMARCGHKRCRELFALIARAGREGITTAEIQRKLWPDSRKDKKGDIQSYVCKIRGTIRQLPDCPFHIESRKDKYFFILKEKEEADASRTDGA